MNDDTSILRWLAIPGGGDFVKLVPVPAPSCGPDVFCKLQDAVGAVVKERERCVKICDEMAERTHDLKLMGHLYDLIKEIRSR